MRDLTYLKKYSFNVAHINLIRKWPLPVKKINVVYDITFFEYNSWDALKKIIISMPFRCTPKQAETDSNTGFIINSLISRLLKVLPKKGLKSISVNDVKVLVKE